METLGTLTNILSNKYNFIKFQKNLELAIYYRIDFLVLLVNMMVFRSKVYAFRLTRTFALVFRMMSTLNFGMLRI